MFLNLLILEECHLSITDNMIIGLPVPLVANLNIIIITNTEKLYFYYLKDRLHHRVDTKFLLSELPKHTKEIYRYSNNPITIYDRILNLLKVINKL